MFHSFFYRNISDEQLTSLIFANLCTRRTFSIRLHPIPCDFPLSFITICHTVCSLHPTFLLPMVSNGLHGGYHDAHYYLVVLEHGKRKRTILLANKSINYTLFILSCPKNRLPLDKTSFGNNCHLQLCMKRNRDALISSAVYVLRSPGSGISLTRRWSAQSCYPTIAWLLNFSIPQLMRQNHSISQVIFQICTILQVICCYHSTPEN